MLSGANLFSNRWYIITEQPMPRPRLNNPQSHRITINFTVAQFQAIDQQLKADEKISTFLKAIIVKQLNLPKAPQDQ